MTSIPAMRRAVTSLLAVESVLLLLTQPGVALLFACIWAGGRVLGVKW